MIAASWPAPEGSSVSLDPERLDGARQRALRSRTHGDGLVAPARFDSDLAARRGRRLARRRLDAAHKRLDALIVGRAQVGEQLAALRDRVRRAGCDRQPADRGHGAGQRAGDVVGVDDEASRSAERVGAQRHRHGAGVAPVARERELETRHARNRGDDAERQAGGGERRALLDVQLEEARRRWVEPAAGGQLPEPERPERVRQRDAVGVAQVALVVVEHAADRPAAEDSAAEARALLEPEGDHAEAAARRTVGPDRLGCVERAEHAERAVEAPAVRRGVQMRPAPDLRQLGLASPQAPDEIAARVARDVEPCLAHPAGHELVGALLAGSEARPVGARRPADLEERVEPLEDATGAPLRADRARRARGVAVEPAHAAEYCILRIL